MSMTIQLLAQMIVVVFPTTAADYIFMPTGLSIGTLSGEVKPQSAALRRLAGHESLMAGPPLSISKRPLRERADK
ncbi:MAG: hypothetical protein L0229_20140 [Blastocatellia bacterium]|nr:hypothetical protein [Blastocatellia bacterium]